MKRFFLPIAMAYTIAALLFVTFMPATGTGANEVEPVVNLSTSPTSYLFDISNMKPGDSIARELTVINSGNRDYYYQSKAKQTAGSEMLYKQLQLYVSTSEKTLFEGSLADFIGFEPRFLEKGTEEDIQFWVEFPWESGNEFQGLATAFEIKLWAEGSAPPGSGTPATPTQGEITPGDGSPLPTTATNMFNLIIGGLLLLSVGFIFYVIQKRRKAALNKIEGN
ncbi:LPXTG cell wall anchor domain-containing protein [Alkalihalobacterium sp. APHAB7]|uniref:LPXTG cell wall anchor domain-containing protein n=1 Tax=Alkalihalobacterium sp. APHAB7 TaxID=3402081 RepID=UPI003AACCC71